MGCKKIIINESVLKYGSMRVTSKEIAYELMEMMFKDDIINYII